MLSQKHSKAICRLNPLRSLGEMRLREGRRLHVGCLSVMSPVVQGALFTLHHLATFAHFSKDEVFAQKHHNNQLFLPIKSRNANNTINYSSEKPLYLPVEPVWRGRGDISCMRMADMTELLNPGLVGGEASESPSVRMRWFPFASWSFVLVEVGLCLSRW